MIHSVRSADSSATAGSSASAAPATTQAAGSFPLDVLERDDGVVVTASVPGIKPEDLEVTIEDNVLTIHGKTEFAEDTEDERFIIRERRAGAFQRSIGFRSP